ncbi:ABC transporter sub-family A-like protein 3 [Leptotrombidium deliense]|uniref:ABC transporter sub-family A-like protein 3 n=1 Tax=Leptotrombidium deliense TaxID=299467 RepID=A0A443STK2_9ACAR|nr:ABC transporter sub-family A-like protein 3 [Leptotrombidium deliense]
MVFETIQRCDRGDINSQQVSHTWLKHMFLPVPLRFYYASFFWIVVALFILFPFYFVHYVYVSKNYLLIELSRLKQRKVWIAYWLFDICFIDGFVVTHLISFVLLTASDTFSKVLFYVLLIIAETSPIFTLVWAIIKLSAAYYRLTSCDGLSQAWKSILCANNGPIDNPFSSNEILRCCEETCSNDVCFVKLYYNPFTFGDYGIMLELIMLIVSACLGWIYIWLRKRNEQKLNEMIEETSEKKIAALHTLAGTKITFRVKEIDVVTERKNVNETYTRNKKDKAIVVQNLVKKFEKSAIIDNISFEVQRGNIFGILGIRGSGTETLIRIMATELIQTEGTVIVNGYKTSEQMYNSQIGYSPEIPVLLSKLTVREIVLFYARVRGLSNKDAISETDEIIAGQNITANSVIDKLTWIQKKKLAIAVSFIGIPAVVLLESPFYGIDNQSRQEMLTNIKKLQNRHNSTVIITSSTIDDCEPLCDRIAVMGLGQIRCIGTAHYLRAKFQKGYFVLLQISDKVEDINSLEAAITRDGNVSADSIFKQLKPNTAIENCIVTKASLEQFIVLTFWIQTLFNKC